MKTPCSDPANNPEDWFIERDGRQYIDDPYLTHTQTQAVADQVLAETGDGDGIFERTEEAIDEAEAEAKRAALIRRRHARDACYTCGVRLSCLGLAIDGDKLDVDYGIRGGYYPEELRKIVQVRDERRRGNVD